MESVQQAPAVLPIVEVNYKSQKGSRIRCDICPHYCTLSEGDIGICGGKQVIDGKLIAINYGKVGSLSLDPIEKKPLYHFFPGSEILSVGPNGCNLSCVWCQNWQVTQNTFPTRTISPVELVGMVNALDGIGIAYTFAEPLIWYEYIKDVGTILKDLGLLNIVITNGYINEAPLKELLPFVDAFNVDLKSSDEFCYRDYCGGSLFNVQRTIDLICNSDSHLEITHLMVTGISDELSRLKKVVNYIASVNPDIPLHISRYFPAHKYEKPATDLDFIKNAVEIAKEKLKWVYVSNVLTGIDQSTFCPNCNNLLIDRNTSEVEVCGLEENKCTKCSLKLNIRI